jgi:hypothetical protein
MAAPAKGVGRGVSDVVRDVVTLTELQAELLRVDAKDAAARLISPLVLLAVAAALGLGTIPVVLLLIAVGLVAGTGMATWLALLISVLVGIVAAAAVAIAGWKKLRSPLDSFRRSAEELNRNINWLKQTLSRPSTDGPQDQ